MEYVLIDPDMFMLQKEEEVVQNIGFFRKVSDLCNSGCVSICLYKEIMDCISNRSIYPFPIDINKVNDRGLKEQLLILNNSFTTGIINNYTEIDIDSCKGPQEFTTDRKDLEKNDTYYTFINMLLTPCYSAQNITEKILVGKKAEGIREGEMILISCGCENKEFGRTYIWVSPDDMMSGQQRAVEKLRSILKEKKELFISSPQTIKGDHHNHIQSTDFNCYEQLAAKNKRVLNYLRYFGLSKIYFNEFTPDKSRETGTIKITKVDKGTGSDIVTAWLFGCDEFRILVELYFPQGIGDALQAYSDNGELSRMRMEELKTELVL